MSNQNGRREFLRAGAVTLGAPALLSAMQASKAIKIGLVGCGGRGSGAAAQALKADDFSNLTAMADVFQERIYCIRWIDAAGNKRYAAPDAADLAREAKVLELLRERFADWQREGFIPSKAIPEGGYKT